MIISAAIGITWINLHGPVALTALGLLVATAAAGATAPRHVRQRLAPLIVLLGIVLIVSGADLFI